MTEPTPDQPTEPKRRSRLRALFLRRPGETAGAAERVLTIGAVMALAAAVTVGVIGLTSHRGEPDQSAAAATSRALAAVPDGQGTPMPTPMPTPSASPSRSPDGVLSPRPRKTNATPRPAASTHASAEHTTYLVDDTSLSYGSGWRTRSDPGIHDIGGSVHYTTTSGAVAQYAFTGTGVAYIAERNSDMGTADVYIDGAFRTSVNLRVSGSRQVQQVVFSTTGLSRGRHTINIVSGSSGSVVIIDALKITS